MHAHQEVIMPKLHGSAPNNLAMVINKPSGTKIAPRAPIKFKSLKEAMEYLKKKGKDEE